MANYHLSMKILSRSSGRSGVGAAAFRARTRVHDERQGLTFDYSKRDDLAYSEIMLPDGAPDWMGDRSVLWNAVEAGEKRKDSQISREIEVSLPRELDGDQRTALVREFVYINFVSKGMVADINLHRDTHNPHAHILLTMRDIDGAGFGQKNRTWNQKALINLWRKSWADIQNQHLRQAGFDITVDHRSYMDRGIDLEPQIKMGPACHNKEGDLDKIEELKRIMRENGERIIANPNIALKALSSHKALFTDEDIHDFVHSHSRGNDQFQAACDAIYKSSELVFLGKGAGGHKRYTVNSLSERYT